MENENKKTRRSHQDIAGERPGPDESMLDWIASRNRRLPEDIKEESEKVGTQPGDVKKPEEKKNTSKG